MHKEQEPSSLHTGHPGLGLQTQGTLLMGLKPHQLPYAEVGELPGYSGSSSQCLCISRFELQNTVFPKYLPDCPCPHCQTGIK